MSSKDHRHYGNVPELRAIALEETDAGFSRTSSQICRPSSPSKNNKISLEYNLTLDKMMSQLLVLAALVATVTAFSPSSARRSTNSLKMSAEMLPGMF